MNIVLLNGGLGNNLFQFAYGYSTFVESNLVFDWSAQKLLFSKSKSSLLECTMPKDVEVFNKGNSSLLFKICNMHLLHLLVTEKKSRVFPRMFFDWFLTKLVHQYLYFRYKDKVEIYLEGKKLTKHNGSREIKVHVGYFQTEKYKFTGKVFARVVLGKVVDPKSIEVDSRVIALRKLLKKFGGNFDYSSVQFQ
jgi:hypothetical protein